MYGELHDLHLYDDWLETYEKTTEICGKMLAFTLSFLLIFYVFFRPSTFLKNDRYGPLSLARCLRGSVSHDALWHQEKQDDARILEDRVPPSFLCGMLRHSIH
jgi:hypothetical protein